MLVDLSGDAPDVDATLSGLAAEIASWRWSEMVIVGSRSFASSWNWKIMVENYSECLHHLGVHRESLESSQPARSTVIADNRGAPWVAMCVDTIDGHPDDPDEWIPGLPAGRARDLSVWTAFPLLMGGSSANKGFWVQLVPDTASRHTITWHLLVHQSKVSRYPHERVERMLDDYEVVHREGMAICARVQAGLASGHLDRMRLAPLEATLADFQRWVRQELQEQVRSAVTQVRSLVDGLAPAVEQLGLSGAAREGAKRLGESADLETIIDVPDALPELPAAVEVAAYRIVMEAVTNSARHAHASRCTVVVRVGDGLCVEITDDGCGLPATVVPGVGLSSMRQRAEELGGWCSIEPAPGGGTRVTARLPIT